MADVNGYIRMIDETGHAEVESETIDRSMLATELIMMQLRLVEGLSVEVFQRRTGEHPTALFGDTLRRLVETGNVTTSEHSIAMTRKGQLVGDAIIMELAAACDHVFAR
jgi:coproporphyrinogen III oxidase-like Fe-S oxidoreductase